MKEYAFDALMIALMAVLMIAVVLLNLEKLYVKLAVIPLVIFYFLGKFSQRKFDTEPDTSNS